MSRVCELTGKGRQVGNNVSHANNKTKRTFLPNLQNVTLISDALGQSVKLRVSTHGLRSVEHVGGLDNWLLKTSDEKLSTKVRKLKKEIAKKAGFNYQQAKGDQDGPVFEKCWVKKIKAKDLAMEEKNCLLPIRVIEEV